MHSATDAVLFVLKPGIPWSDLPGRFGKPNTLWKRYDRWYALGVWERLAQALGIHDEEPEELEGVQLDATSVKAHPTASTGRRLAGEKKGTPTRGGASAAAAASSGVRLTAD